MAEAIAEAIRGEMLLDDTVFLMGEDVGVYGGSGQQTAGLYDTFGADRVRDTPVSEAGFIGAASGAAIAGLRPVVELMRVDFCGVAFDQIINYMAKVHYVSNGQRRIPLTLISAIGNPLRQGAIHAQTLHGLFAHVPGLKVVLPSTSYDAKGLLASAIRDDAPVLYLFHGGLLGLDSGPGIEEYTCREIPEDAYTVPLGQAEVRRNGADVTIVAISLMVHEALRAANELATLGVDAEVVDLRCLVPLDVATVRNSVDKTGRLLVVDEDYERFGAASEMMATVVENCWDTLVAPPKRVARGQVPVPYSRVLDDCVRPTVPRIVSEVLTLMGDSSRNRTDAPRLLGGVR